MTSCLYWSFCLSFKYTNQALHSCVVIKWNLHMDSNIKIPNKFGPFCRVSTKMTEDHWRQLMAFVFLLYDKNTSTGCLDTGTFVSTPSIKSSLNLSTTSQFGIPFELHSFLSVIWLHQVMLLLSCVVWSYAIVKTFAFDWWLFSSWKCSHFLELQSVA